jgi:hypothetical protein
VYAIRVSVNKQVAKHTQKIISVPCHTTFVQNLQVMLSLEGHTQWHNITHQTRSPVLLSQHSPLTLQTVTISAVFVLILRLLINVLYDTFIAVSGCDVM